MKTAELLASLQDYLGPKPNINLIPTATCVDRFEQLLVDARFVSESDQLFRRRILGTDALGSNVYGFDLARRWSRKPTRVPQLIVESRLVIAYAPEAELLIRRSEENYLVISVSGVPGADYHARIVLDTRHNDPFALSMRRHGIQKGNRNIPPQELDVFLQRIFSEL